ncbi:MAG: hypothetical protein HY879_18595 [Deltaproteobacteria bacterium]|nr:hypothetical protein [Deltaproteobacteria bacterium]
MTVLIAILIINGYIEIQRTRSQLFNILETEALLVIKGLEKNSGNLMAALTQDQSSLIAPGLIEKSEESLGIEDLLIERLINLALQLDQEDSRKAFDSRALKDRVGQLGVRQVFFLKSDSRDSAWDAFPAPLRSGVPFFHKVLSGQDRLAVFRGEGPLHRTLPLAVAVARRFSQGAILIVLSFDEYAFLSRQIIIQGFLEDFSGKGNIAYLNVEESGGKIIARTGEGFLAGRDLTFERTVIRSGDSGLFWIKGKDGEFLEILRPFRPSGKDSGWIRLGLSLKEINPIIEQARRQTIMMSLILLGLGLAGLFFIFRLQGRHLQRMREMEDQIRLKEELSAMGQLAAGVAHEIKNPLNAISLVVQRLEKEFVQAEPEEQKEYEKFTRIVRSEIDRVNRIIGQFLMMARPPAIRMEEQSVVDILNYVLEVMEEEFRQKGIRVIKTWDDQLPLIPLDRFQLTQAFINIFNNALEAMPEGGEVRLDVKCVQRSAFGVRREKETSVHSVRSSEFGVRSGKETGSKRITQHSELHGDFMEISVADTGKGIPPEGLKKIFAPYYTTKEKGVGLGLAITQKIVQAHEGTLEVQSRENKGTTVVVRLPVSSR